MPIQLSGSLVITGSITTTGVILMSGSIASASYSSTSDLLQGTGSVGFATTASLLAVSSSQQQISASLLNVIAVYATTGSNSFRANQSITGSLVVSSTITAQTLVVQTITSSIEYSSGSNIFGSTLANTQTFTGSLFITGSNITANVGTACFSGNVCGLNLISKCNIRVGTDGGYAIVSGPTTGAAISLGSNSATFDRNLSLGLMAGDLTFSPVLTINAQTSNVGIGMCTPDRRLYITDPSSTQNTFLAYNQGATFCGTVIEAITDRTCNSAFNLMNLKASTTSMFIVKGDGKVGIGLTSPAELLEVSGSLKIGNLKIENVNGGSIGFNRNTSNGVIYNSCYAAFQINGAYSGADFLYFQNYSGSGSFLGGFVLNNGNIGIGTTNPSAKLEASGTDNNNLIMSTSTTGAGGSIRIQANEAGSYLVSNNARPLYVQTNSATAITIASNGITTFSCRICISVTRTNGADSTALILQDNVTGVQTPGYGLRLAYQSNGTGVQSVIGLENGGTGTNNESQISFYTQNTAGGLGKRLLLTSGGDAGFSGNVCAVCLNSYYGVVTSNSVITKSIGGTMQGVTATYFDFPTWDDSGQGQMFEIKAFFDHFYNWNYGAHYYVYLTSREGNSQALTMFSCPTSNGGSWMAYKTSATNLRVCKIAGGYGGGGAYWVQVTAKQP
jgi:hypothetical protein